MWLYVANQFCKAELGGGGKSDVQMTSEKDETESCQKLSYLSSAPVTQNLLY